MPAGRPTKYTPELIQASWDYVNGEWKTKYDHAIPSVQGMCSELNITETTAYDWAKHEEKEYSEILAKIKTKQHHVLIDKGLKNEVNSNIAKLALGKHDYKERTESEHTVDMTAEQWLEVISGEGKPTGN